MIHSSKIEKFAHFKSYIGGVSLKVASEVFFLFDQNYITTKHLLKERFGRNKRIISSQMRKLISVDQVNSCANKTG